MFYMHILPVPFTFQFWVDISVFALLLGLSHGVLRIVQSLWCRELEALNATIIFTHSSFFFFILVPSVFSYIQLYISQGLVTSSTNFTFSENFISTECNSNFVLSFVITLSLAIATVIKKSQVTVFCIVYRGVTAFTGIPINMVNLNVVSRHTFPKKSHLIR